MRSARPSTPRPPPTPEAIAELARRERVPARIAKGELDGKMKCRIWRKLHPEEARRFDEVYKLMEGNPGLDLATGFGVLQSGLSVSEFLQRRARTQKKQAVREARGAVDATAIDQFLGELTSQKTELAFVLSERALLDVLVGIEPIAFQLERVGRLEKLQVVTVCRRPLWERRSGGFARETRLTQKPAPVPRQPDKRPYSDPRPFLEDVGRSVRVLLRNGLWLMDEPLRAVGPFDLLLGPPGDELFVPLHAVVKYERPPD